MRTVWKYMLEPGEVFEVNGGRPKVVHVGRDPAAGGGEADNLPAVWIELDPDDADERTTLQLIFIGTGHPVPASRFHVGSMVTPIGLVWHVYASYR